MRIPRRTGATLGAAIFWATALGSAGLGAQTATLPGVGPARADTAPRVFRIGLGLGGGEMGSPSGAVAARGALTWSQGRNGALTLRAAALEEFDIFGPTPAERLWDVGVLYGRQTRGKRGYASASAGVALVGGVRRGARTSPPLACGVSGPLWGLGCLLEAMFTPVVHEEKPFRTVGIPVELEAGLTLTRVIGLNATAWAVLNTERTATGASVGLVLGRLR